MVFQSNSFANSDQRFPRGAWKGMGCDWELCHLLSANNLINQGQPSSSSSSQPARGWAQLLLTEPDHSGSEKETNILNFLFQIQEFMQSKCTVSNINFTQHKDTPCAEKQSHLKCKRLGERGKERILFKLWSPGSELTEVIHLSQLLLSPGPQLSV